MVKFFSLGSGSSGNCYYLGNDEQAILIDAGIPVRTVSKLLKDYGLSFGKVMAVLVTHDHCDHIRAVGALGEVYHIPIYSTHAVHDGIERSYSVSKKLSSASRRILNVDEPFYLPGTPFRITAFRVPHDSTDNVGYYIECEDGDGKMRFCLATDVGHVTPEMRPYLAAADHLVIEANHDVEMLRNGSYPADLKRRVSGEGGHLSNAECAALLQEIVHPEMRHIFLCHLSAENNKPEIAYRTVYNALFQKGIRVGDTVELTVLPRNKPSLVTSLESLPSRE